MKYNSNMLYRVTVHPKAEKVAENLLFLRGSRKTLSKPLRLTAFLKGP